MWFLLNNPYSAGNIGIITTKAIGSTSEISPWFGFRFWKSVYYKVDASDFLSHSTKNVVSWLVSPTALDMIQPLRYFLMIPKIPPLFLTFILMRDPRNTIFYLNLFVGSHIPFSNSSQTEIIKGFHILKIFKKEWTG